MFNRKYSNTSSFMVEFPASHALFVAPPGGIRGEPSLDGLVIATAAAMGAAAGAIASPRVQSGEKTDLGCIKPYKYLGIK